MKEKDTSTTRQRIETIDVLRGFALAGILYAHMVIWYTGAALPPEVYFKYDSTMDGIAMGVFGAFVYGKFFSVFSFLFGLSFFLYFRKYRSNSAWLYSWRLFLLLCIGLLHHIFWRGDILAFYAVLGMLLLFFRHLPPKVLFFMALVLILDLPVHVYEALILKNTTAEVGFPMQEEARKYYALVRNGDFKTVLFENWKSWPAKIEFQLESGRLMMTFGYFLLGLYAGGTKLFTAIGQNIPKFKRWNKSTERIILALLLIALLMYLGGLVSIPEIKVAPDYKWIAGFLFSLYNASVSIFYITGITMLFRNRTFYNLLKPLAPMGKMALTNYLLQSFFGLLIFYDFGLGLFDQTSPAVNVLLAVGVFYIQLKFSQYWLKHFRQGPMEWLWRSLTYFKFPPLKKEKKDSAAIDFQK